MGNKGTVGLDYNKLEVLYFYTRWDVWSMVIPRLTIVKIILNDPNIKIGKTSRLNPLFVEEMMGFPEGWTISPFQGGEENP